MTQGYLSRPRQPASAHEPGVRDRVVGRPEGTLHDQRRRLRQQPAHAVYLGHVEGLVVGEGGQYGRQGPGEQGLAAAGRAEHEQVVSACGGDLQGALRVLLAPYVGHVHPARHAGSRALPGAVHGNGTHRVRGVDVALAPQVGDELGERRDRHDVDPGDQSGLLGVDGRHEDLPVPLAPGHRDHGQDAVGMSQAAVQGELAEEDRRFGKLRYLAG